MAIRFKCPHCEKSLAVKDHLAGKKGACPACKQALVIPEPVDMEALAAAALTENAAEAAKEAAEELATQFVDFTCPFCDEELHLPAAEAGKKSQCPECRRIIKIPLPDEGKPKDWRDLIKKGPSAALINQPEQLDDAWGTEVKTRVSGVALEEAGALPEKRAEPVGAAVWIKRIFWTGVVCGGVYLLYIVAQQRRSDTLEKDAIKVGMAYVDPKDKSGGKSKLAPLQTAEVYRCLGELYIGKNKRRDAMKCFRKARAVLGDVSQTSAVDQDFFLSELCESIVRMGGEEKSVVDGSRYGWIEEIQQELTSTLQAMKTEEGKAMALRRLGTLLMDKKQPELAWSLASALAASGPRLQAQQIAQLVGSDKTAPKGSLQPPNLKTISGPMPYAERLAYTEANVRKGNFDEALEIAGYRFKSQISGPERMEASLGAAQLLLLKPTEDQARQAQRYFQEALAAYDNLKGRASPWLTLQLVRVGYLLGEDEKVKDAAKRLDGAFQNRAQLERVLAKIARAKEPIPLEFLDGIEIDTKADKDKNTLALAWSHLARHNTRLGKGPQISERAAALNDENLRPFLILGRALGLQDVK